MQERGRKILQVYQTPLTLKLPITNNCHLLCHLLVILKVIFVKSVDPEQSDLGPNCLPVCKNRFEKFARIFSRQHKQTILSDSVFLGALRVKLFMVYSKKSSLDSH